MLLPSTNWGTHFPKPWGVGRLSTAVRERRTQSKQSPRWQKATIPCRPPLSFSHPFLPSKAVPCPLPQSALPPGQDFLLAQVCHPHPSCSLTRGPGALPGLNSQCWRWETRAWGPRQPPLCQRVGHGATVPSQLSRAGLQGPFLTGHTLPAPLPRLLPNNLGSVFWDGRHALARGSSTWDLRSAGLVQATCLSATSTSACPT